MLGLVFSTLTDLPCTFSLWCVNFGIKGWCSGTCDTCDSWV